jgi:hypothetical protein
MKKSTKKTGRIGRFLCRIGMHKWGPKFPAVRTLHGMSLWGTQAQDCQREGCSYRLWHWPS